MIRQYHHHWDFFFFHMGLDPLTLCRVDRGAPGGRGEQDQEIVYYRFTTDGEISSDTTGSRYDGFPQCVPEYKFDEILDGSDELPILPAADKDELRAMLEEIHDNWDEEERGMPKPSDEMAVLRALVDQENSKLRYSVTELFQATDLIYFLLVRFLAVAVLTYLLDRFAKRVPLLATQLTSRSATYGRLMPVEHDPTAIWQPTSYGLQDDPGRKSVNWAGGRYGMSQYLRDVRNPDRNWIQRRHTYLHRAQIKDAEKDYERQQKGKSLPAWRLTERTVRRNLLGHALGFGAAAGGIVGVPAAGTMARDVAYRTLMTGTTFGMGSLESQLHNRARDINLYGGHNIRHQDAQAEMDHQHRHHHPHGPRLGRRKRQGRGRFL